MIVARGLPHTFLRALHICGAADRAFTDFSRAMAELLHAKTAEQVSKPLFHLCTELLLSSVPEPIWLVDMLRRRRKAG